MGHGGLAPAAGEGLTMPDALFEFLVGAAIGATVFVLLLIAATR